MKYHQNHAKFNKKPNFNQSLEEFPSLSVSSNFKAEQLVKIKATNQKKPQKTPPKKAKGHNSPMKEEMKYNPNFSVIRLCCRMFFFDLERILPGEDKKIEYKSYRFPFSPASIETLKKTVCAFINSMGGIIYIGVKETTNKKYRYILGNYLTQNEKEELIKSFRKISESIYPHCTNNLQIEFVPIRKTPFPQIDLKEQAQCYFYDFTKKPLDLNKCPYLSARYVIRVRVASGNKEFLYSYVETECQLNKNSTSKEFIPFRSQNEVLVKEVSQEVLKIFKQRLLYEKEKVLNTDHEGPCPKPDIGSPRNEPQESQNVVDVKELQAVLNQNYRKKLRHESSSSGKSSESKGKSKEKRKEKREESKSREKNSKDLKDKNLTTQSDLKQLFKHPLSYIVKNLSEEKLKRCLAKTPAKEYAQIQNFTNALNNETKILIVSINGYHHMQQFLRIKISIEKHFEKENVELIGISKSISIDSSEAKKVMKNLLVKKEGHKYSMRKRAIDFYSLSVAASYFLYMRELGYQLDPNLE